jgi:hypothetical protein
MAVRSLTELASPLSGSTEARLLRPVPALQTQSREDVRSIPVVPTSVGPLPAAEVAGKASMGCPSLCPRADSGQFTSVQACSCTPEDHDAHMNHGFEQSEIHAEVTTVVSALPDLSRVPRPAIGQTDGKGRRSCEECPSHESPLDITVIPGQCTPGLTLDHQAFSHAFGVSGVTTNTPKNIPPHRRSQEPPGGCPGKTTPLPVMPLGGGPGKTMPSLVTTAYIRVTPKSDAELEADDSCNAVTYVHGDRQVMIWESSVYDYPEQCEEDEIARNRIIWERGWVLLSP